jgi:hypothetical protein
MRASLARQRRFVVKAVAIAAAVVGMGFLSGCDIDVRSLLESCTDEARIVGTDGPDVLRGTAKDDVISSLGGDDTIIGAGGDDLICGGDGNDTIRGDSGIDVISGDAGDDRIEGGADVDVVYFVFSPAPVTTVDLAAGTAVGWGSDTLLGIDGVIGSDGADTIAGDNRPNFLAGGLSEPATGADTISGRGGSTRSTVRPETTRSTVGRAWISSTSRWRPVAWRSISPRELPEDGDPIDSWVSKPSAVRPGATPSPVTPTTTTSTAVEERMSPEAAVGATSSRAAAAAMRLPAELGTIASTVGAAATVSTAAPGAIAACTASRSEAVPKPPS